VLFVSGYTGQTVLDHKVVDVEHNFLQKPFTLTQLANKVRTVLDHKPAIVPTPLAGDLKLPYGATAGSD
jgi:hypothetical protein